MAIKMKRQMWLVLGVAILLVGGCGGGGGGGTTPPADPRTLTESYFPFSQGNLLNYEGRISESGTLTDRFFNALTVGGTHLVGSVSTTVITESNPENGGVGVDLYYHLAADGITDYGNNDATDTITEQLVPYPLVEFPMVTGSSFVQLNKSGLTWDTDEDGDGTPETFDIYSVVTLAGFETLTLRDTPFADTARLVTDTTITVHPSTGAAAVSVRGSQTLWCAPDYGPIKRSITVGNETTEEEAVGMRGSFGAIGLMPQFTPLTNLAPAISYTEQPGRPAIASDGTNFLIVSAHTNTITPFASTLVGALVDGDGNPITTVPIATLENDAQFSHPAAIFDGTNYLVIFQTAGEIRGRHIQSNGTPIGSSTGFLLSSGSSNFQPVLAFDSARALVAWAKYDGTDYDIYGTFIDELGPDGAEFSIVNEAGGQDEPAIAFDGLNYLILYRNYTAGQESETADIYGRRINTLGAGLAPAPMPVCTALKGQGAPQLAFDGTNYFAVWIDLRNNQYDIYGTGIDTNGNILDGTGIAINTRPNLLRAHPNVSFDGTNYLVTWASGDLTSTLNSGIFGNRVTTTGDLLDATATELGQALSERPAASNQYIYPVVHFDSTTGHSVLTWVDNTEVSGTTKRLRSAMIWPL